MLVVLNTLMLVTMLLAQKLGFNPFRHRALFKAEFQIREIIEDMNTYLDPEDSLSNEIKWFIYSHNAVLRTLEQHGISGFAELDRMGKEGDNLVDNHFSGNILHIFAMVRRCSIFVDKMVAILEERHDQRKNQMEEAKTCNFRGNATTIEDEEKDNPFSNGEYLNQLIDASNHTFWPDLEDLRLTALSLARIQYVYQLPVNSVVSDLLQGKIGSHSTPVKMFVQDAAFVAEERLSERLGLVSTSNIPEYGIAIEWLEAGYNLSLVWYGENNSYTGLLRNFLISTRKKHDLIHSPPIPGDEPSQVPNEIHLIRPIGTDLSVTARSLRMEEYVMTGIPQSKKIIDTIIKTQYDLINVKYDEFKKRIAGMADGDGQTCSRRDFFALCRGEKIIEIAGNEPFVAKLFHDVFTENQVELLKEKMIEKGSLEAANVFRGESGGGEEETSTDRTQNTGWLFEGDYPELIPLSRRLDHVTGLQVSFEKDKKDYDEIVESEDFQIGVYGPGGLYLCHEDPLTHENIRWRNTTDASLFLGDRAATLMLYLNDVDDGRTVFPHVGIFATPSKGAALFWFNMGHDGTLDRNSVHGGCPVLYGTKWGKSASIQKYGNLTKKQK